MRGCPRGSLLQKLRPSGLPTVRDTADVMDIVSGTTGPRAATIAAECVDMAEAAEMCGRRERTTCGKGNCGTFCADGGTPLARGYAAAAGACAEMLADDAVVLFLLLLCSWGVTQLGA